MASSSDGSPETKPICVPYTSSRISVRPTPGSPTHTPVIPPPSLNPEPPLTPPSKRWLFQGRRQTQFLSPDRRLLLSPDRRGLLPSYPALPATFFSSKRTSTGHYRAMPETPDRLGVELASPGQVLLPKYLADEVLNLSEKLTEILHNLKTRLSYAFLKVKITESPDDRPSKRRLTNVTPPRSTRNKHRSLPTLIFQQNNFLNQLVELPKPSDLMDPLTTPKRAPGAASFNFEQEDTILLANEAFMAAISRSSPRKALPPNKKAPLLQGPLSSSPSSAKKSLDERKEREAVQSLLSLSSPQAKNKISKSSGLDRVGHFNQSNHLSSPTPKGGRLTRLSSSTEEEDEEMAVDYPVKSRSSTPISQIKSGAGATTAAV